MRRLFSYREAYRLLFSKEHRRQLLAYMGYAEDYVLLAIWPIFALIIIGSNFEVGFIIGISFLAAALVTLLAGRFLDLHGKRGVLRGGALTYALTWLLRMLIRTEDHCASSCSSPMACSRFPQQCTTSSNKNSTWEFLSL